MTTATETTFISNNTAERTFRIGQRVRVLPHTDAPSLNGKLGTISSFPVPLLGEGDYGAFVAIDDDFTWHLYSHRIEAV